MFVYYHPKLACKFLSPSLPERGEAAQFKNISSINTHPGCGLTGKGFTPFFSGCATVINLGNRGMGLTITFKQVNKCFPDNLQSIPVIKKGSLFCGGADLNVLNSFK